MVEGDWPYMVGLKKESEQLTIDDFKNNYTKLFTKDFLKILSTKTYKDVEVMSHNDTLYYSFYVGRDDIDGEFEGSVRFYYEKSEGNNKYKISSVLGAGGNFYEYKPNK